MSIPLKLRERPIGGAIIDASDRPSTIDLTDTTYKADWCIIAKRQRYFVIIVDKTLVTLTYKLKVIDAMRVDASTGNARYNGSLSTTIYNNLKLKLAYVYSLQTAPGPDCNFESEEQDDWWFIDQQGRFKFRKTIVVSSLE